MNLSTSMIYSSKIRNIFFLFWRIMMLLLVNFLDFYDCIVALMFWIHLIMYQSKVISCHCNLFSLKYVDVSKCQHELLSFNRSVFSTYISAKSPLCQYLKAQFAIKFVVARGRGFKKVFDAFLFYVWFWPWEVWLCVSVKSKLLSLENLAVALVFKLFPLFTKVMEHTTFFRIYITYYINPWSNEEIRKNEQLCFSHKW